MTPHELLADLRKQGFQLTPLPGGKLEVKPASELSEALRDQLRRCKAEVLALLARSYPYINDRGELFVPFDADPRYHWWKPGSQSIAQTLAELQAPPEVWRRSLHAIVAAQRRTRSLSPLTHVRLTHPLAGDRIWSAVRGSANDRAAFQVTRYSGPSQ